jgi:organic radical activating enzyme
MATESIVENTGPKYSEMLVQLVQEFDKQLPEELTFEETLEVGIDAWNLANNKEFLVSSDLYEKELKAYKDYHIIDKMVEFKIEKFPKCNNVIVDYSMINNTLQVKTQTQENRFNSIIQQMVNVKTKND